MNTSPARTLLVFHSTKPSFFAVESDHAAHTNTELVSHTGRPGARAEPSPLKSQLSCSIDTPCPVQPVKYAYRKIRRRQLPTVMNVVGDVVGRVHGVCGDFDQEGSDEQARYSLNAWLTRRKNPLQLLPERSLQELPQQLVQASAKVRPPVARDHRRKFNLEHLRRDQAHLGRG